MNDIISKICNKIEESSEIDNKIIEFIISDEQKYIYGNSLQVAVCLGIFRDMGVQIDGILLPPGMQMQDYNGYWGELIRKKNVVYINDIEEAKRKKVHILLAVPREDYANTRELLSLYDYMYVHECCWKHNSSLQQICYDVYKAYML